METLRRLAVLGLLILLASTARAEEASLFSFAEDTPAPTVTALPTPAVTVTPESGFFLEVVREEEAFLFCEERIAPYIQQSLTQVRRTTVRCSILDTLPQGDLFRLERRVVQLSSVRADALIAHVFKLSRADAQALFAQGRVFVDGRACADTGYTPKEGEILSVRGFGRMKYAGVDSLSKKGKSNTAVEVFV